MAEAVAFSSPTHVPVRPDWLAARSEAPLEPGLPIVDAHHHLYDRPGARYLLDDILQDIHCGHDVRATVFVQARAMLRAAGPPQLRPLGETEFANGMAAMSASGLYGETRVNAGIVGQADLTLGNQVQAILERHIALAGGTTAEGGRFCGVRQTLTWDADASLLNPVYPTSEHLMETREFRAGFARLAPLGLTFEGWAYFHQLPKLAALAREFPDTSIVINHCGGVIGIGSYEGRREEVFRSWRNGLHELARCPNVMIKLSGLGMRLGGFGFERLDRAPGSVELADAWRPWIETCIEAFGPGRCMFGSNFPVDKGSYGYGIGLNAIKRLTASAGADAMADIFWRSAKAFYRLPDLVVLR
jgi:L-fuconolactonase